MSSCLHCGARPHEQHMRICPHSSNPSEWVIADAAPEAPPRRRLSAVASGTQSALERIAEIRAELDGTAASETAPVAFIGAAEGDRSSDRDDAATGPPEASDDVGGCAHAS